MNIKKTSSILLSVAILITTVLTMTFYASAADSYDPADYDYAYKITDYMSGTINSGSSKTTDAMTITVQGGQLTKFDSYTSNGYTGYAQWNQSTNNIKLTFALNDIASGKYKLTLFTCDNNSARGKFDISANDTAIGTVNCLNNTGRVFVKHAFTTEFTTDGTSPAKIEIVPASGDTSKQLFLYSIALEKVDGEDDPSDPSTLPTEPSSEPTEPSSEPTESSSTPVNTSGEYVNRPTDYFSTNINANTGNVTRTSSDSAYAFTAEYGLANYQSNYVNGKSCLQWQPQNTGILTFKFFNVEPAVYRITINSADNIASSRSYFDIAVNDTYNTTLGFDAASITYTAHLLDNTLSLENKGTVTVKLTNNLEMNSQNGRSTKQTMIESVVLSKIDDVARDPLYVETTMKKGASIRLSSKNGIRFHTQVDTQAIDSLISEGATVECGTLIAPEDLIEGQELTFDLPIGKYVDVQYDLNKGYFDDNNTIVGSLVNIKTSNTTYNAEIGNLDRPFVGRGYVKVTKGNDTYINYAKYFDYNITNNSRSLAYIALALQGDETNYSKLSEQFKSFVDSMAEKHGQITEHYFDYITKNYDGKNMTDTGVIMLPKSYCDEGKPVRLVIDCHGYSATINSSEKFYNKYKWLQTLVHDGYAVLAAVTNAYHMATPFAIDSYVNAYKYVTEHYNVYDEVYVNGNSMGGITSINLVCSGKIPVIAHSMQYPVTSIVHQLYYNEWAENTRRTLARFYNFDLPNGYTLDTFPFTSDIRTFGSADELSLLENNFFDKIANGYSVYKYSNILNSNKDGFASGFEDFISCNTQARVNELYSNMTIDYPVPVLIQQCLDDGSVRTPMTKLFANSIKKGNSHGLTEIYYNGSKHGGDIGNDVTYLAKDNTSLSVRQSSVEITNFITNIENTITDKK